MAPKHHGARVTFEKKVKTSGETSTRKRKNQNSGGEQTSRKRARRLSPEDKVMRMMKGKNPGPLQAELLQYIESCINTAVMSVLSRKKVPAFESIQGHMSRLRQRLLSFCKDLRVPATKLGKLRNLTRDVQEEKRRMEEYEDTLEELNRELEEAVESAEKMEDSIENLERKIETLKEEEEEAPDMSTSQDEMLSNKDALQLPPSTFQVPTLQDQVRNLQNPELILKELSTLRADPVYKNLQTLLPMCYAEISTL